MAFLKSTLGSDPNLILAKDGLVLRPLEMNDYGGWAELRALSREHLAPWEPVWARNELTKQSFRQRVRHYQREAREDTGYGFGIFANQGQLLIGGLTLSNVRRGVSQAATLGYWLGSPYVHRGFMRRAVATVLPFAFYEIRLHRLEAASMPSNLASIRVLENCGFVREGFARSYLKINGAWQDHVLFGLTVERYGASRVAQE